MTAGLEPYRRRLVRGLAEEGLTLDHLQGSVEEYWRAGVTVAEAVQEAVDLASFVQNAVDGDPCP